MVKLTLTIIRDPGKNRKSDMEYVLHILLFHETTMKVIMLGITTASISAARLLQRSLLKIILDRLSNIQYYEHIIVKFALIWIRKWFFCRVIQHMMNFLLLLLYVFFFTWRSSLWHQLSWRLRVWSKQFPLAFRSPFQTLNNLSINLLLLFARPSISFSVSLSLFLPPMP